MAIADSTFDKFINDVLARSSYDIATAAERRGLIERHLASTNIPAGSWFESGSFAHGTAVRGRSDVDYMIRMKGNRPGGSGYLLERLKVEVPRSSRQIESARRSAPTVQVHFVSDPDFELVPAYYALERNGQSIFYIPDTSGGWAESAPRAHLNYVNAANNKNLRTKSVARLVKQWKYVNRVPVSSFYLEMRVAAHLRDDPVVHYDHDFPAVLRSMQAAGLRAMNDPTGSVNRIPACSSETKRMDALSKIWVAISAMEAAKVDLADGRVADSWIRLRRLFGDEFPCPAKD